MLDIAIFGAGGRMGLALVRLMQDEPQMRLVRAFDAPQAKAFGQDIGIVAGVGTLGVTVEEPASFDADVVIDFSLPSGTTYLLTILQGKQIALVSGTTGLHDQTRADLEEYSRSAPVLWAPNFSFGMNLLGKLAAIAARVLGDDYDIEIIEAHHRRKKDAPSGSARMLGQKVAKASGVDLDEASIHGRSGETGERPKRQIAFHAIRGGDTVGDHTVWLAGPGERLELTHRVQSRDTLATGALKAAMWLAKKPAGLYDMSDMLGLNDDKE